MASSMKTTFLYLCLIWLVLALVILACAPSTRASAKAKGRRYNVARLNASAASNVTSWQTTYNNNTALNSTQATNFDFHYDFCVNKNNNNWTCTMNQYVTQSLDYFHSQKNGFRVGSNCYVNVTVLQGPGTPDSVSGAVDWGYWVHVPYDQGSCLSCWATTAVSVFTAHLNMQGQWPSITPQQIIDCSNRSCGVGSLEDAFNYITTTPMLEIDSYNVNGTDVTGTYNAAHCVDSRSGRLPAGATLFYWNVSPNKLYYNLVPRGDEQALMQVVASGPVAAAVDGSTPYWVTYASGTIIDEFCDMHIPNHAVTVFGFGVDTVNNKVWHIRNSWGAHWGKSGNLDLLRFAPNMCGVATNAYSIGFS